MSLMILLVLKKSVHRSNCYNCIKYAVFGVFSLKFWGCAENSDNPCWPVAIYSLARHVVNVLFVTPRAYLAPVG
jgi:hypothetical protein